jgi:hypothetical protein
MYIDVSKYKVVYDEKVLRALAIVELCFDEKTLCDDIIQKPKFIAVAIINEDGNVQIIRDETWRFQFIPIIGKGE